jgi:hypothetical protein
MYFHVKGLSLVYPLWLGHFPLLFLLFQVEIRKQLCLVRSLSQKKISHMHFTAHVVFIVVLLFLITLLT